MPMPKGKRFDEGYVTLTGYDAMNYRTIAQLMSKRGWKMNHATARGVLFAAMKKVARRILIEVKGYADPSDVERLASTSAFQGYVGDVVEELSIDDT